MNCGQKFRKIFFSFILRVSLQIFINCVKKVRIGFSGSLHFHHHSFPFTSDSEASVVVWVCVLYSTRISPSFHSTAKYTFLHDFRLFHFPFSSHFLEILVILLDTEQNHQQKTFPKSQPSVIVKQQSVISDL